jgi:hypothetical protein
MNKHDDAYIKKFQKEDAVAEHRHQYHEVDGIYFDTEEEKQNYIKNDRPQIKKINEAYEKQKITTTVATTETTVLKTEELIELGEILNNPKYNNLLENHFADLFGSKGEMMKLTDETIETIIDGILETAEENVVVQGYSHEPEIYINIDKDGRQMNELKTWVKQKLTEKQ